MKDKIRFEYEKGEKQIFPNNNLVKNWLFKEGEEDEAILADSLAEVAEKNGLSANDLHYLFPYVLRMLKSDIDWSK